LTGLVAGTAVALVIGAADWVAVAKSNKRAEYVLKPATLVAFILTAVAFANDAPDRQRWWTVAALVFSLAGDVWLMLPRDLFVPGLASFLVAHVCYAIAFTPWPHSAIPFVVAILVGAASTSLFLRVRRGIFARGQRELVVPVAIYVLAISVMVVAAISTLDSDGWRTCAAVSAAVGAGLFYASDTLIGFSRFVREWTWAPLAIIVTYHLGQAGLVLALAR
jgi:uncharacterized membrane protein YhhN